MAALDLILLYSLTTLAGLIVGSFLNVVIYRLPRQLLGCTTRQPCSLARPGSHCPGCKAPIKPWHNIPLFGYLWLGGRCYNCQMRITPLYPLVEASAALLAIMVMACLGPGIWGLGVMILSWGLLALAVMDMQQQLLPDALTLPLLWLGLISAALMDDTTSPTAVAAILGAAGGYGLLWLLFQAHYLCTGRIGMGHGDFKLTAVLGAWLGWTALPWALLTASASALLFFLFIFINKGLNIKIRIPFGPFLALGGWLTLISNATIAQPF